MAINWTPARLEVDLNYKSKDIILASEWNNLWKETRLQGNNNTDGIVLLIELVEGNIGHLTNLDNLFADLESKVTAHTGNSDIHVTSTQKTAWTAKYDKPSGGIPKSDLASAVQSSLDKADSALQQHQDISALTAHVANNNVHVTVDNKTAWTAKYDKPAEGIPKTDLASAVQTSLGKADTALQEHQDISDLTTHVANSNIHVTSEQKTAWSAKYDKPSSGIPKSDLASAVQTSLGKADSALQEHQDISALTNHVANNDIHVTTDDKTAWNSKAEVFTIIFSHDENENPIINKTFDEIVSAFNSGKTLRLLAGDMLEFEGELVFHSSQQFSFILVLFQIMVIIVPSGVIEEDADIFLPTTDTVDAGKILKVDDYGKAVWTEDTKANVPTFSQYTILTSGWSSGVYSFESAFPSATCDIEIELDSTATESQVEAWSSAKVTSVFGTNTMKALGDVPTVDIPVIVKKVMK